MTLLPKYFLIFFLRVRKPSPVIPSLSKDLYGRLSSLCHPERSRGISMGGYPLYVIPSLSRDLYGNTVPCVISKAREDLPCLQRVKRARRNRRRMGVCPWQLVAESASFSAADYRAQASGEIFGNIPRELYAVCLATLTAYNPRAAGQRPIRLAAVPFRRLAQGDKKGTHMCHPEPCEGSLYKYHPCVIPSAAEGSEPNSVRAVCS